MEAAPEALSGMRSVVWAGASIAAVLFIGFMFYQFFSRESEYSQMAYQYWPSEEGLPVKMSKSSKYDAAMNAFKQEEWQQALEELTVLETNDTVHYFLGVVAFEKRLYSDAIAHFEAVDEQSVWFNASTFRLGLAYLASGNPDRAKTVMTLISKRDSARMHEAQEVIKKL